MSGGIRTLAAWAWCGAAATGAWCAAGADAPTEADLVLLQPYLDRTPLGSGIEAYQAGTAVLVPLGELCRLLAFGITVAPDRRSAAGFFISPGRTFRLDLDQGRVESQGRRWPMPRAARMPRDIYVDARSLMDWFPLEADVDLKGSVLLLKAKEKLPIQGVWERENQYGNAAMTQYGTEDGPQGQPHPQPYAFMTMPSADLVLGLTRSAPSSAGSATGSATLGGDLLWMSSDLFVTRDPGGSWNESRATLFRESPQGGLLGAMSTRRVQAGDLLVSPELALVGSLPQGRGLNLDNYPLAYRTRFAGRTFRGPLPQGWSVELFQNGSLLGFQPSRPDGLYEFKDAPLRFGVNLFRLVFHGPLGETREETHRLDIAQDQPAPGEFFYGLTAIRPEAQAQGTVPSSGSQPSYLAQADYGLDTVWSAQGGVAGMPLQDGFHTYGMAGLRGGWSFLTLQLTGVQDRGPVSNGQAMEGVLSMGSGYSSLSLRRDEFRGGFQRSLSNSVALGATGLVVKDASGVDLNWTGKHLSLTAEVDEEDYAGGTRGVRQRMFGSTQIGRVSLANSMTQLIVPGQSTPLQGVLTATSFSHGWSWQGSLTYGHSLTGWGIQQQFLTPGGIQYQFALSGPVGSTGGGSGPLQVNAGLSRMSGRYGIGLNLQKTGSAYSGTLQFQVSLGREPRTGRWVSDAQSLATTGAVSAIAFLDTRGTGVRSPEDPVLSGARFKVGGAEAENQVKDGSVTLITKLTPSQPVEVSLDEASLEDPAQKSSVKSLVVVPRPGTVERLEFPVVLAGEVNGTTRILRDGKREELPGLEVELLNAAGQRVKAMRSAYDGFFEFTDLPYGEYLLRVTPEEAARVGLNPSEPRRIQVRAHHSFLDGMDLVVEPRPEPTDPAAQRSHP